MDAPTLAAAVRASGPLLLRFLEGFTDDNCTAQASALPNHVVWTLGHCALTMHRLALAMDGGALPESDFMQGDRRDGDHGRYDTESVCFGSVPMIDPARYPSMHRARCIFEAAIDRLAAAAEGCSDLSREIEWHGNSIPAERLVLRVCFHNGCHAGQLTDLRRALALPPVIH